MWEGSVFPDVDWCIDEVWGCGDTSFIKFVVIRRMSILLADNLLYFLLPVVPKTNQQYVFVFQ